MYLQLIHQEGNKVIITSHSVVNWIKLVCLKSIPKCEKKYSKFFLSHIQTLKNTRKKCLPPKLMWFEFYKRWIKSDLKWPHGTGPRLAAHLDHKNGLGIYVFHNKILTLIVCTAYNTLFGWNICFPYWNHFYW